MKKNLTPIWPIDSKWPQWWSHVLVFCDPLKSMRSHVWPYFYTFMTRQVQCNSTDDSSFWHSWPIVFNVPHTWQGIWPLWPMWSILPHLWPHFLPIWPLKSKVTLLMITYFTFMSHWVQCDPTYDTFFLYGPSDLLINTYLTFMTYLAHFDPIFNRICCLYEPSNSK